jgi:hypothetical protein
MPWWAMWVAVGVLVVIATRWSGGGAKTASQSLSLKIRDPKARADVG